MKKLTLCLLIGALAATAVLSGCSTSKSSSESSTAEASSKTSVTVETTAPAEEKETTVFDENGIKLVYTGYTNEIFPTLTFRIENSTQNSYMVNSEDVSINDSMISTSILETVAGGKKSNVEMVMLDSDLKKNGIEKIEKVEFKLSVTNSDDFKDSFESGVITITNP